MTEHDDERLLTILVVARDVLERRIEIWCARYSVEMPVPMTAGFCRGAAWGLRAALRSIEPNWAWTVDGGWGDEIRPVACDAPADADAARMLPGTWPGGMQDDEGLYRGHYWVVGELEGRRIVVDLTADQFGHEPIVLTDADDDRYGSTFAADQVEAHFYATERSWGEGLADEIEQRADARNVAVARP